MNIITLANQKGGCAKTTTVWALGTGLNDRGKKVLLIDLDAQTNLSYTANVDLLNLKTSLYDVFKGKADIENAIQEVREGLDIVTGGLQLSQADLEFMQLGHEFMLKECLDQLGDRYDYCVIDTEPHLGLTLMNALTASDRVIIPIQADVYGLQGTEQLQAFIQNIKKYSNPDLYIDGLLVTRVNVNTNIAKALLEQIEDIAERLDTKVYNTKIRATVAISESALLRDSLFNVAPKATAAIDYNEFINEFLTDEKA